MSESKFLARDTKGFSLALLLLLTTQRTIHSFQTLALVGRPTSFLPSSLGDGPPSEPPPDDDDSSLGSFLTPREESENLKRAREYMSSQSLPISFDSNPDVDQSDVDDEKKVDAEDGVTEESALVAASQPASPLDDTPSPEALARNPYVAVVSQLTPSELISKFTSTADSRVQDAVRTTILGLIGNLPKMAFETTTITTGQRLASLMFQLQMTGYMFKNAEYRLSLSQSLGMSPQLSAGNLLPGVESDEEQRSALSGDIMGKVKIRFPGNTPDEESAASSSVEMEVDAASYMSELRGEVQRLQDELSARRQEKEEIVRKDLLTYIRTLPAKEMQSLTSTMSHDVLVAMKGLVNAVLSGIGEDQIGPNTVTEQTGEALAQLCMWQLAIGYNLRELEVREEMKNSLSASSHVTDGVDLADEDVMG